jgi:hypothetical protein
MKHESIKEMICFSMYFTKEQYASLQKRAFKSNVSISDYIKAVLRPVRERRFIYKQNVIKFANSLDNKLSKFINGLYSQQEVIQPLLGKRRKKYGKK